MNITCPECGKLHKLPKDHQPERKSVAKCKKCDATMIINPQTPSNDQTPSESQKFDVLPTDNGDDNQEKEALSPSEEPEPESANRDINNDSGKTTAKDDIYTTFPEIKQLSPEKFVFKKIFSATGKKGYRTRENRLKLKIIKAVHDILSTKILQEDEQVMGLAKGIAYHSFEITYANGLLNILSNYFAIVCTNQRLLLINIDSRVNRPTRYIFQMCYDEINSVSCGPFRSSLIIKSKTGRNWNFTTIKRNLAKSLRDFIFKKSQEEPVLSPDNNSRYQLCPACYIALPDGLTSCPHCSAVFKKPKEAMLRSFVLPGLGSIYLRHLPLGIMEMAGYLIIWILAVILMILKPPGGIATAIAPVLIYHMIIGLLSLKTAKKGYIIDNRHLAPPIESPDNGEDSTSNA